MIGWRMYCSETRIDSAWWQELAVVVLDVVEEHIDRGAESSWEKSLFASAGHLGWCGNR